MVIEENPNANYLAHFKTKGAKNGIRRFQSYAVAPNPSGATGREIGEAAAQRSRVEGHDRRDDDRRYDQHQNGQQYQNGQGRNEAMQRLQERVAPKKKTMADKLQDKKKKKWAKSYRSLYKHADEFSSKELNDAITRLDLKDKIKNRHMSSLSRNTQDGANTLRNIAQGSSSMISIYNALALGYNAYNTYKGTSKKYLPTIDTGKIGLGGGGGGKKNDKKNDQKHDSLEGLGPYLEHFGVKGQSWFTRHFQSYKTAPTRSGKVGVEVGLAAKQAERNGDEEDPEVKKKALQESNRKALESAGFKDTTPAWYGNYNSTKNVKNYSIEMHDPANDNHSDGVKRTNATLDVNDNCYEQQIKAAIDFSKNFEKHDAAIKDAIVNSYFSSPSNVPWLYEKGYADELPLGKRFINGKSFEEQKKFFRDHLGIRADTSKDKNAFSTGGKTISLERGGLSGEPDDCTASVYYSDGGAYFGHVFTALIDLKTGKVHDVSIGG